MDACHCDQSAVRQHESGMWIIGTERDTMTVPLEIEPYRTRDEALAALPLDKRLVPIQDLRVGDVVTINGSGPGPLREPVLSLWVDPDGYMARVGVWWGTVLGSRFILAQVHLGMDRFKVKPQLQEWWIRAHAEEG